MLRPFGCAQDRPTLSTAYFGYAQHKLRECRLPQFAKPIGLER